MTRQISVETHLPDNWAHSTIREDVRRTFEMKPRILRPLWLYDDRGAELFDQITRLPEYYPTEAERSILVRHADEIASRTGADTMIELGSGTSEKTRTLLDAFWKSGRLRRFVPLDVSTQTLLDAADMLAERYDGLNIHVVVGDFTRHLRHVPSGGRRLAVFLGGTVGNFYREERRAFLGAMADSLAAGEWLLLGVDLLKNSQRTLDAYNDRQGVTADFIGNALVVLNRELDADFPVGQFDYVPLWDGREQRVDMRLRASASIKVRLEVLDMDVLFAEGEELRVEISTKFTEDTVRAELAEAGFDVEFFWKSEPLETDSFLAGDFGLALAKRR